MFRASEFILYSCLIIHINHLFLKKSIFISVSVSVCGYVRMTASAHRGKVMLGNCELPNRDAEIWALAFYKSRKHCLLLSYLSSPSHHPLMPPSYKSFPGVVMTILYFCEICFKWSHLNETIVVLGFLWLIHFTVVLSVLIKITEIYSFLWLNNILLCTYTILFLIFTSWWLE